MIITRGGQHCVKLLMLLFEAFVYSLVLVRTDDSIPPTGGDSIGFPK